jgi:hypothetical protein
MGSRSESLIQKVDKKVMQPNLALWPVPVSETLSTIGSVVPILFDITVGIVMGYRLYGLGARFFSSAQCPDWVWGPLNLLSYGYQELKKKPRGVKCGQRADNLASIC